MRPSVAPSAPENEYLRRQESAILSSIAANPTVEQTFTLLCRRSAEGFKAAEEISAALLGEGCRKVIESATDGFLQCDPQITASVEMVEDIEKRTVALSKKFAAVTATTREIPAWNADLRACLRDVKAGAQDGGDTVAGPFFGDMTVLGEEDDVDVLLFSGEEEEGCFDRCRVGTSIAEEDAADDAEKDALLGTITGDEARARVEGGAERRSTGLPRPRDFDPAAPVDDGMHLPDVEGDVI